MDYYKRKPQPAVRALQWDGTEERWEELVEAAGPYWETSLISYQTSQGIYLNILTKNRDDTVRPGDWVLLTDDGPFVSRKDVFEKWYERAEIHA